MAVIPLAFIDVLRGLGHREGRFEAVACWVLQHHLVDRDGGEAVERTHIRVGRHGAHRGRHARGGVVRSVAEHGA